MHLLAKALCTSFVRKSAQRRITLNLEKKKSRKVFACGILFCSNEPNPMVLRLFAEVPLPY